MQGSNQQAYDRGTTIFSPDGRLYQVEYAREAVTQGSPVVGVRAADGVALAAVGPRRSPLVEPGSVEKLYGVDDHLAVGSAGHAADARKLVDLARRAAQEDRVRYGEPTTTPTLATTVADHLQEHTQTGGARPYGTTLLLAGVDDDPRLFEIDPSGATREWRATAIGNGATDARDVLEADYDSSMGTDDAVSLSLRALAATGVELTPETADAVTLTADGRASVAEARVREEIPSEER
ncbi:archaeal proteasome endopeptidase complex subunit alpha [Halocalculus aciditolerans]|uniref:Proteasome subunit alpha n=1 Tax=Halocalculus aciditolerans TaxID=1383812 RepID=A0A830FIY6_9EURY|nr:archaeal proteasome endopeptidase complex subunit alpha [Halocalculus aciditolerans]GGL51650.1 proteasome endopeptidase complex,subunit alpha [Halocalculus aciditolerans]